MFGCCSRKRNPTKKPTDIIFGISAILGRCFSALGSFYSVQKSTAEPIALALRHTTHPNERLSTFNTVLSYALAGLYSSGDGMLKGLSEANRIFDVTGEIKSVSCGIYYMNSLLSGLIEDSQATSQH